MSAPIKMFSFLFLNLFFKKIFALSLNVRKEALSSLNRLSELRKVEAHSFEMN